MDSNPKFCSNCGEKVDYNNEMKKCPKCGTDLDLHQDRQPTVIESLPYKSPGTAALIAFIGGTFGLPGIGHIYVGKVGKGIVILVGGFISALMIFVVAFLVPFPISTIIVSIIVSGYVIMWIWQIFNARKLAKKFNETVRTTRKEPW